VTCFLLLNTNQRRTYRRPDLEGKKYDDDEFTQYLNKYIDNEFILNQLYFKITAFKPKQDTLLLAKNPTPTPADKIKYLTRYTRQNTYSRKVSVIEGYLKEIRELQMAKVQRNREKRENEKEEARANSAAYRNEKRQERVEKQKQDEVTNKRTDDAYARKILQETGLLGKGEVRKLPSREQQMSEDERMADKKKRQEFVKSQRERKRNEDKLRLEKEQAELEEKRRLDREAKKTLLEEKKKRIRESQKTKRIRETQ